MKTRRTNIAVSEIVGTILILFIAVLTFSFVYFAVLSFPPPSEAPLVDVVGMTAGKKSIILSHQGGDDLPLDTIIIIEIGGKEIELTVADLMDEKSIEDGFWNIGEELVYNYDLRGLQVEARIIDKNSNSVIMTGILQEGAYFRDPYVLTLNATNIQANSVKLSMEYNFWNESGSVRFSYKTATGSWINTPWAAMSGEDTYELNISGLVENTNYQYKAQLTWGTNLTEGGEKSFVTATPTIVTLDATDVKTKTAMLWMQYDFKGLSGSVRFSYRAVSGSWIDTLWVNTSGQGTYGETITGLVPTTIYEFKAQLKYNVVVKEGGLKSFVTWSIIMGMWTFSEGVNSTAYDTSGLGNHGTIFGADWTVGVNTTGLSFDGVDDYVRVYDSASLDITQEATVEAWVKPLENSAGLIGDITNSLIDTSWFGPDYGYDSDLILISGDIYAIAFRGDGNDGYLVTAIISFTGLIKNIIDFLEFETSYCYEPDVIHIANDVYAIAYEGPGNDGFIKTVEIMNDGQITDVLIDTFEFDTLSGREPTIVHVNGSIYAIAYVGDDEDGYVKSVEIMDTGMITNSVIDTSIFCDTEPGTHVAEPRIIYVGGNNYAIVFRNPDDDGEVRTITILDNGIFSSPSKSDGSYVNKFTFDQYDAWRPRIQVTHINSDIYACCYRGRDGKGTLVTIDIASDAIIQQDIIDKFYFETITCNDPELHYITSDYYAIVYRGVDNDGFLIIVEISGDGMINDSVIDAFEFEPYDCYKPTILYHTGDIFIIAYTRYNEGFLKTVRIPSNVDISTTSPIIHISRYCIFDFIEPDIIHIYGDVFAIACRGLDSDGYLRTIQISNNGDISNNVIDLLEFDLLDGRNPKIIHVAGNIYAIAYRGPNDHGFIKTVEIMNDGQITDTVIDTLEFDTNAGYEPDIIHTVGNIYAIAYRGPSNHGFVKTLQIMNSGQITDTVIDTLEFENSYGFEPNIIHIGGNVFAIAYRGPDNDGFVKTFVIWNNGEIQDTVVDSFEYDTNNGYDPDIINISNNIYAIVYSYQWLGGYLATIEIADTGIITKSVIDSTRWDNRQPSGDDDCYDPHIIHISGWVYAIVYRGEYDGYVKTLRIGNPGDISDVNDDYLMFDAGWGYEPQIIHIDKDIYAIPFSGYGSNAELKTVEIKCIPTTRTVVLKQGAYGLQANSTTVFGHINSRIISAPLPSGFSHVVLTYNRSLSLNQMKLYVNGVLQTEVDESSSININGNNLIMGEYNCVLDEVTIWNVGIDETTILANYNLFKP